MPLDESYVARTWRLLQGMMSYRTTLVLICIYIYAVCMPGVDIG